MAQQRLATWMRPLASPNSRRTALGRGLLALAAGGLGLAQVDAGSGKKRKRKKGKKGNGKGKQPKLTMQERCDQECGSPCRFCLFRTDGSLLCGGANLHTSCPNPCDSDNDCVGSGTAYCVHTVLRSGETSVIDVCNGTPSCADATACDA